MGQAAWYAVGAERDRPFRQDYRSEVAFMFLPKGYYTSQGYTGFLPDGSRMAFPTQDEYLDFVREARDAA